MTANESPKIRLAVTAKGQCVQVLAVTHGVATVSYPNGRRGRLDEDTLTFLDSPRSADN